MDTQIQDILKKCTVEGVVVKLPPGNLDRDVYVKVSKALEGIGGKWKGHKIMGFVFATDPKEMLEKISGGEKINLKKDFQFFATQPELADELVELADIKEKHAILEPSAGDGAIVKAIARVLPNKIVDCFELMGVNRTILENNSNVNLIGNDFIAEPVERKYDRIVANPPFTSNQDIDHLYKMYDCLKDGGRVVCITSIHWRGSTNKKETAFRDWLTKKGASVKDVPAGAFKKSGTGVPTVIITITK